MKKIFIILLVLVTTLAAVLVVGNQIIEETIDRKITQLESKGIQVVNQDHKIGFLNSKRHYEIIDNDKKYGIDLKYSNIPFTDAVSLDLYSLSISKEWFAELQMKDQGFAKYLEQFLQNKGLLYHMNYNLISGEFDGFVKDIDESYTMQNRSVLEVKLKGTKFHGNGDLRSPTELNILSQTAYLSAKDSVDEVLIDILNLNLNAVTKFNGKKMQLISKFACDRVALKSNNDELNASKVNYDLDVVSVDKQAYKEFISSRKSEDSLIRLLSKGADINLKNFSSENININKKDLKGFRISSDMQIEADKNLVWKMNISPLLALSNLDVDFKSRVSKKLIDELLKGSFIPDYIVYYKPNAGEEVIFDLLYKQGKLSVNGKRILG